MWRFMAPGELLEQVLGTWLPLLSAADPDLLHACNLVLLRPRPPTPGRLVYLGPSRLILPYLGSLGFVPPPMENPADFCMDVIR